MFSPPRTREEGGKRGVEKEERKGEGWREGREGERDGEKAEKGRGMARRRDMTN